MRSFLLFYFVIHSIATRADPVGELLDEMLPHAIDCEFKTPALGPLDAILISTTISLVINPPEGESPDKYKKQLSTLVASVCKETIEKIFSRYTAVSAAHIGEPEMTTTTTTGAPLSYAHVALRYHTKRFHSLMSRIDAYRYGRNKRRSTVLYSMSEMRYRIRSMFIEIAHSGPDAFQPHVKALHGLLDDMEVSGVSDTTIFKACSPSFFYNVELIKKLRNDIALIEANHY